MTITKNLKLMHLFYVLSAFILILFMTILILFQIYFAFRLNQSYGFILPVSLIISFILSNKLISTPTKFNYWLIIFLIFILASTYSFLLFDKAGDGRTYHQETIVLIKNGWNPIFDSNFINNIPPSRFGQSKTFTLADELLASSFALTFGHIQIGKIINILFVLSCFCITFIAQNKLFKLSDKPNYIISAYIALNPLVMSQLQSFYLDGNLFLCYTIFLYSLLVYLFTDENEKYFWLIITCISFVILSNLKMTGLIIGSIVLFISLTIYIVLNKKPKGLVKLLFGLSCSFVVISWHPYLQNILRGRNIFWPILGNHSSNVFNDVTKGAHMAKPLLFLLSYLSPFPMDEDNMFVPSLRPFVRTDTFIGALGPLFGILLLFGLYYSIKYLYSNLKDYKVNKTYQILAIIFLTSIITILINPAPWWTKYSPTIILIPVVSFIALYQTNSILWNKLSFPLVLVIIINSGLFYSGSLILTSYRSYKLYEMEKYCRDNQCYFEIENKIFETSLTNQLIEDKIKINIIKNCDDKKIIWEDAPDPNTKSTRVCI